MKTIIELFIFAAVFLSFNSGMKKETPVISKTQTSAPCGLILNQQGQEVRWNNYPIQFHIEQGVDQSYHAAIRDAADQWNERLGFQAIQISENPVIAPEIYINYNVIYAVTNPFTLEPEQEAITKLTWIQDNTESTNILINFARFQFSTDTVDENQVDMTSLMIHEFGHALGLPHSDDSPSVMHPVLEGGQIRQRISDIDKASVLCAVARKAPVTNSRVASNP